jgi:hypothetical protein
LAIGKLAVNLETRIVSVDDQPVQLTGKEYAILELTQSSLTLCWREMDSNFQYASLVRWHQATDLPLPPFVEKERSESGRADYRAMSR